MNELSNPLDGYSQGSSNEDGVYFTTAGFGTDTEATLTDIDVNGSTVTLTLSNASENDFYDIFFAEYVTGPWQLRHSGPATAGEGTTTKNYTFEETTGTGFYQAWLHTDTDFDGLPDGYEIVVTGTTAGNVDSDASGVADGNKDSDADGWADEYEMRIGTDPLIANGDTDTDGDGIPNWFEMILTGTNTGVTQSTDTDGDGWIDWMEIIILQTNPLDPGDTYSNVTSGIAFNSVDPALAGTAQVPHIEFTINYSDIQEREEGIVSVNAGYRDGLGVVLDSISPDFANGLSVTTSGNQGQVTVSIQFVSMFEEEAPTVNWSIPQNFWLPSSWIADPYDKSIVKHTESHLQQLVILNYQTIEALTQTDLDRLQAWDAARIGARWQKIQRIAAIPGGNLAQKALRMQRYVDEIHTISTRLKAVMQKQASANNWSRVARWAGPVNSVLFAFHAFNGTDPTVNGFRASLIQLANRLATGQYGTAEWDADVWDVAQFCEQIAPSGGLTFNYVWGWLIQ